MTEQPTNPSFLSRSFTARVGDKQHTITGQSDAYNLMQEALANRPIPERGNEDHSRVVMDKEKQQGFITDVTTEHGRCARSARNVEYLQKQVHDCPEALVENLTQRIAGMDCALKFQHTAEHQEEILRYGKVLSNKSLEQMGKYLGDGGTVADDAKVFGNTDFVFTRPCYNLPLEEATVRGNSFLIPTKTNRNGSWMSLNDWQLYAAGETGRGGVEFEPYAGNLLVHEMTHPEGKSFVCDFFYKEDIPKSVALKTSEVLKTAIALHPDDSAFGFDHQKALKWIKDAPLKQLRDKGNGLKTPLSHITLSESQSNFLRGALPEAEALIEAALSHTIGALKKHAEIKVPSFVELGKVVKGVHL